jgi:hypothetical protein
VLPIYENLDLIIKLQFKCFAGSDPGFQVRGAHLKQCRRAEGGAKIVGVFRVKNHDFTPKKSQKDSFEGGFFPFKYENNEI